MGQRLPVLMAFTEEMMKAFFKTMMESMKKTEGETTRVTPSVVPEYAMTGIRVKESPKSLSLLHFDPEFGTYFIPFGKVEEGETPRQTALRNLREDVGFVLSPSVELVAIRRIETILDNAQAFVHVFGADVPLLDLFDRFRTPEVSRSLYTKRPKDPEFVSVECPLTGSVLTIFPDKKNEFSMSHGHLVRIENVRASLELTNPKLFSKPLRYPQKEFPFWSAFFEVLDHPKLLSECSRREDTSHASEEEASTKLPTTKHGSQVPPEVLRQLPKLPHCSGSNDVETSLFLRSLPTMLLARGIDPTTPASVLAAVGCFTDKLARWWSDKTKGGLLPAPVDTLQDLVNLVYRDFNVRDDRLVHLQRLRLLEQSGSLPGYISKFNEYLQYWSEEMTFELQASLFLMGISDTDIRATVHTNLKNGQYKTLNDVQEASTALATMRGSISTGFKRSLDTPVRHGPAKKPKFERLQSRTFGSASNGLQRNSFPPKHRVTNKVFRRSDTKGNPDQKGPMPIKLQQFLAAKKQWNQDQLQDLIRKNACFNCGKTGHPFQECPKPKPKVD